MKNTLKMVAVTALAGAATLGASSASAWWGNDYYDGWGGPWGGGPWYGGYGYPYRGWGWGGYPYYGGWGGYPYYGGWGGYPYYGGGWGYPAYGWGVPAYTVPVAPTAPASTSKAK